MSNIAICYYKTPVGELIMGVYENQLCLLDWRYRKQRKAIDHRLCKALQTQFTEKPHPLHTQVTQELDNYFSGSLTAFNLPLLTAGTDFQKEVWKELLEIPYGQTVSYITLSRKLHNEKAIRAVASANGANALSIVIPCHRVIGSNGDLTGYAGGLLAKKKLLQIEGALNENQIELF